MTRIRRAEGVHSVLLAGVLGQLVLPLEALGVACASASVFWHTYTCAVPPKVPAFDHSDAELDVEDRAVTVDAEQRLRRLGGLGREPSAGAGASSSLGAAHRRRERRV